MNNEKEQIILIETIVEKSIQASKPELESLAKKAAEEAVDEVLKKLGFDTDNVKELQTDFITLRKWRKLSEKSVTILIITLITMITAGIARVVWDAIRTIK